MSHYEDCYQVETTEWPKSERIDVIGRNGNTGEHYKEVKKHSKYSKEFRNGMRYDVYDVLHAFNVTNPAIQHALKKMLCAGTRGYKDFQQDLEEAIEALEKAKLYPPVPF